MEEEIIFKIELNRPEAEADLRAITTATVSLKEENKLLQESIKNLQKAEGDNTKQIVEATAQIELNKNKIRELNQQQGSLIKTLDAEKGSINQLKAANAALLKERDNISKSTAEGKARIEALNKQYDENSKKINENISDTERQKQGYNTLIDILDKINPGTKELVTNVGSITKGFSTSIGAINQYGFSLRALGSIPVLQLFTALTSAVSGISQLYKSTLPTVEDYRKENEKLTKEYEKQQTALTLLEASTKRQVDLLRAEGKEKEANQVASKAAADRLIEEQLRANQLSDELEKLNTKLAATPAIYDKVTGTQQINKAEQDVLKEAIAQVSKEFTTQKEVVATVLNEYNILQEQAARLSNQEAQDAKEKAAQTKKELEDLEALRKKRQELIDQRRIETLERAKALKGTGGKSPEDLITEAYNNLQDEKTEKDEERIKVVSGINDRFLEQQKERDQEEKKSHDEKIARDKAEIESAREKEYAISDSLAGLSGVLKAFGLSTKALDIGIAIRNVYKGITEVLAAKSVLPEPLATFSRIANTATVLFNGLSAVTQMQKYERGGIADTGGVLSGPSHSQGGVKFSVGGRVGFEAEGGEAIINKRSTAMFRSQLSAINRAGGGKSFETGGVLQGMARQSEANSFNYRLLNQIEMVKIVLPVQNFELKQREINSIKRKAVVLK